MEHIAQIGNIGIVHIEHIEMFVWLGQIDRQPLEYWIEINVELATAAQNSRVFSISETVARREEVRWWTGRWAIASERDVG